MINEYVRTAPAETVNKNERITKYKENSFKIRMFHAKPVTPAIVIPNKDNRNKNSTT